MAISKKELNDNIDSLTPFHDALMKVLTQDKEYVEYLTRTLMNDNTLEVVSYDTQYVIPSLRYHSVTLDIIAKDKNGQIINIEIQRETGKASPYRATFYACMIETMLLAKNESYESIPPLYVFFLNRSSVKGGRKFVNKISLRDEETGELFNDRFHIIYVNAEECDESELGIMMHDMCCSDPNDMKNGLVAEKVRYFKDSEEGRSNMSRTYEQIIEDERKEAIIEAAKRMIAMGKNTLEEVAECMNLSLDEVKELAEKKPA